MNFVWVVHGQQYIDLASRSAALVKRHHPDAFTAIYVDKDYPSLGVSVDNVVIVNGYHDKPFMLMNVLCQYGFLASTHGEQTIFLDADAFLAEPIEFPEGADMAVTWRDNLGALSQQQPYNYGVIMAESNVHSLSAWAWMADRITRMAPKQQDWYGNQLALRELVGPVHRGPDIQLVTQPWFDVNVAHLPCAKWNWTPPDDEPKQKLLGQKIVHLKGTRKDLLDYYLPICWGDVSDAKET